MKIILQVEIVDNILKEEKQMKKRYQQQPQLWPEKQRERVKVLWNVRLFYITHNAFVLSEAVFIIKNSTLLQRINRRRPKPKFFKSTSGSSSVEYSADVEDTGVRLHVTQNSLTGYNQHLISPFNINTLSSKQVMRI